MRLAILGATSQIARDFVRSVSCVDRVELGLFARRPEAVREWLSATPVTCWTIIGDFASIMAQPEPFDAVVNFVGSGNPAQTARMGAAILDITHEFDSLALDYLRNHPGCRYIFFSSGAAYGGSFTEPAAEHTPAVFPINRFEPADWYGAAKMYAECRHRTLEDLPIVDIRVFNYFSASADIEARFLITDILRAIMHGEKFRTSEANITRDYAGPQEICSLIQSVLAAPPTNAVVDCFTREPVDKLSMLESMRSEFGLRYELVAAATGMTATGNKTHYYTRNHKATELFGYVPKASSLEVVIQQAQQMLRRRLT